MKYKKTKYFIQLIGISLTIMGCPNRHYPPPYDCQSTTTIAVTDPCTSSYPGLVLNASGYNISAIAGVQLEWKIYLQKDTVTIDTNYRKVSLFYDKSTLMLPDTLVKNAPGIIVSVSPKNVPCPRNYILLTKKRTSNAFCPVWQSRKI